MNNMLSEIPYFYSQADIQLIEALAWLNTSKDFEFNFVQKFFNREFTGQLSNPETY